MALMWPESCTRVVIVAPRVPENSGGAKVVESYVPMFEALGLEVQVVSMHPGTRPASFPVSVVIRRRELHRKPLIRGRRAWARFWLAPVVALKRIDWYLALRRYRRRMSTLGQESVVVFTHVAPLTLLRRSGHTWTGARPILIGQHHSPFLSLEDDESLREQVVSQFSDVDGFVALTPEDATLFARILHVPCFAVTNPTGLPATQTSPSRPRVSPPPRNAIALARLSPEKRIDLMIRAFARATSSPRAAGWTLEIFGEGAERASLQGLIDELGVAGRIRLMGEVDDVRPELDRASLNLLTSRYEGIPMSVLDAAQCGVATLAFACTPGVRSLITALHGHLVEPVGGEAAYVEALEGLLGDEEALRRSGDRARSATGQFSPQVVVTAWSEVVADLVQRRVRA